MAVVSRGCVLWEERGQKELLEAYFELIPTLQVFLGKSGAFLKTLVKKIKKKERHNICLAMELLPLVTEDSTHTVRTLKDVQVTHQSVLPNAVSML